MDKKELDGKIMAIATAEAEGDEQEAGNLKQELFTGGIDYNDIEAMVKKASGKRAKEDDGTFKADDKSTPDKNEAFETGVKPDGTGNTAPVPTTPAPTPTPVVEKKKAPAKKTPAKKKAAAKK